MKPTCRCLKKTHTHPVLTYNQIASSQAVSCCNIDAISTWSQTGPHVFCVNIATIGWVCFFLPWWMSKANYETNSSGTGSFPNVISVNIIIVQMNVNSSTIIVQVEYHVDTVTQQAPNLSLPRAWCGGRPAAFCILISYSQLTLPYTQLQNSNAPTTHNKEFKKRAV